MKSSLTPLETDLLSLPGTGRDGRIIARHFGLDGKGGANFRVIGDELGLTRERVRQIVDRSMAERRCDAANLRTLDRAIAFIASCLPARCSEVENKLRSEGLTSHVFRLEGIANACSLVGRGLREGGCPFSIRRLGRERFVVSGKFPQFAKIRMLALRAVRRCGIASVSDCFSVSRDPEAARREEIVVTAVLSAHKGIQWLDKSSEWFWFLGARHNPALTRIRKMLCVAASLTLQDLRAGLAKMIHGIPPDQVLLAFCRSAPGITVKGGLVSSSTGFNLDVLNPTERILFRLLAANDGCVTRPELFTRANDLGIKRATFYQCVHHSPILFGNGPGYRLVGFTGRPRHSPPRLLRRRGKPGSSMVPQRSGIDTAKSLQS